MILAQAATSLDSVPAEFIKYFLTVAAFLAANYFMLRKAGGRRDDPLHLKTPIETKRSPLYAEKLDVDARLSKFEQRLERIEKDTATKFAEIMEKGHSRELRITHEIHQMRDEVISRIEQSLQQAYSRINDTDRRIATLEGKHNIRTRAKD
jgi:hypothetical protein